ncbi:MAG: metal-dependent transcriptional regulator [Christensenellales bacterium]
MKLQESAEMYLETILVLSSKSSTVRSVDIAEALDYKKPSVSVAMKKLRENGYITVGSEGYIFLTDKGREVAETIYERHNLLSGWLMELGVEREIAVMDACRMEHVISPQSFDAIKKHVTGKPGSRCHT